MSMKDTIWLPGTRVMVDNARRATITKVLNHAGDPTTWRYLVHLDAGGDDVEVGHSQLSWQSDYGTRTRLEEAGFKGQYGGGGYFTEAFNEVVYANRSHDYAAKHPEDSPPIRPQPTVDHILDALSLLPRCREEFDYGWHVGLAHGAGCPCSRDAAKNSTAKSWS